MMFPSFIYIDESHVPVHLQQKGGLYHGLKLSGNSREAHVTCF